METLYAFTTDGFLIFPENAIQGKDYVCRPCGKYLVVCQKPGTKRSVAPDSKSSSESEIDGSGNGNTDEGKIGFYFRHNSGEAEGCPGNPGTFFP